MLDKEKVWKIVICLFPKYLIIILSKERNNIGKIIIVAQTVEKCIPSPVKTKICWNFQKIGGYKTRSAGDCFCKKIIIKNTIINVIYNIR